MLFVGFLTTQKALPQNPLVLLLYIYMWFSALNLVRIMEFKEIKTLLHGIFS